MIRSLARGRRRGRAARALAAAAAGLALAAAAALGTAVPAAAQTEPENIAPLKVETDINGVNLTTGRIAMDMPVLSVPAAPNLRFDRLQNAAPYVVGRGNGTGGMNYTVYIGGGSTDAFECELEGDCVGVNGTGALFNQGRYYTQPGTGAVYHFGKKHVQTDGPPEFEQYYLSQISYRNGEVITYSYDDDNMGSTTTTWFRPIKISSNTGYYISIAYQSGTTPNNGWGNITSAAIYRTGTTPTLLRRFTYDGSTVTDWGDNATNVGGRSYVCTGCNNGFVNIETWSASLRLPGETTNTLQVAPLSQAEHVVGTVSRDGMQWTYAYGRLRQRPNTGQWLYDNITVTGPEGYRRHYVMVPSDLRNVLDRIEQTVVSPTEADPRTTDVTYDLDGRLRVIVAEEGNRTNVDYDDFGNIVLRTTTPKPGSTLAPTTESASYPDSSCATAAAYAVLCWRPDFTIDALSRRTDFDYNAAGQLTLREDPLDTSGVRRRTSILYESATGISRPDVVTLCGTGADCGSADILTAYDYYGSTLLPTEERRSAGGVTLITAYAYEPDGRVRSIDGPLPGAGDTTHYRYDDYRRRVREIGPLGENGVRLVQLHTYRDSDDKVVRTDTATVVNPDDTPTILSHVEYSYDSRRNPVTERVISGTTVYNVTQRKFDDLNRVECEARRMNATQFALSNLPASACDRDSTGTYGSDRITRFFYNAGGELLREVRAYGLTGYEQNYATYSYTENGQRASVTDANGNRAEFRYDGLDRLSRWYFPHPTTAGSINANDYEAYTYDAVGNRLTLRKREGLTLTYYYDGLNRMIRKVVPPRSAGSQELTPDQVRDVFYDYDVLDLMTYARFAGRASTEEGVTNNHDGFGRLVSSTLLMDGVSRMVSHRYDAGSRRTRITHPDGTAFTYAYDDASRLTALRAGASSTSPLLGSFTYTPRGQVDVRTELHGSGVNQNYDAIGRLSSIAHSFAGGTGDLTIGYPLYNPANQIERITRSNDAYVSNRATNVSRGYTVNGLNQYTQTNTNVSFDYDANGNLTLSDTSTTDTAYVYDVENRLVAMSGGRVLSYDPLGRLYEATGASGTRRFLWDGDALIAEYQTTGAVSARFVHGPAPGVDDPLVWNGGGDYRWLHADHQGSIVAIANDTGVAQWINAYDPWGIPNTANAGRFGYTGQIWLPDFGLYHYKARMYSPTLGRFLQVDPVGYDGGINLYGYVGNDPVNRADPTGLVDIYVGGGGDDWFTHQVENYARANGGLYFSWTQGGGIIHAIRQAAARGEPINAIGHSYGGSSLLSAVHMAGVRVNLLITIDPVGGVVAPRQAGWNAREWVNVTSSPSSSNLSDWIAWLGGKTPEEITGGADANIISSASHGSFTTIMRQISARGRINVANRQHRRRQGRERRSLRGASGGVCPELRPGYQCGTSLEIIN